MRALWPVLAFIVGLSAAPADPRLTSIHPFTGQRGSTFTAKVRGSGLAGARAAVVEDAALEVTVESQETAPPGRGKTPVDVVTIRVSIAEHAKPGRYPIRLITRNGVSNALPLHVTDLAVAVEPPGPHDTQDAAIAVPSIPAFYAGKLEGRGEADYFAVTAEAGQTITFELKSGLPQIASAGSAATVANFDPALSLYRAEGSWFDPKRLKRIAHNDEPVWVFGKPTDAHLVHRFTEAGTYLVRVEAFAGQGGPDYSYSLKIVPGEAPPEEPPPAPDWKERAWVRKLGADRLDQLAVRGGKPGMGKSIETWRASPEITRVKLPATVEGTLMNPGETHRVRFEVDGPADIALEVETPAESVPFFNPIVRLLNGAGEEVATNLLAGKGACSGALTKSLQSKTLVPLRDAGEYTLEVRDATADLSGADFRYRVQLRPQVPHLGEIKIEADHLNLTPGEAKTVRVIFDREEDYRGAVMVTAESLPAGVLTATGADFEPDKDDPPAPGKRERYMPRTERAVLVFTAAADASPHADPAMVHVVVRPVVDGKPGEIVASKTIPVMVVEKQ